MFVKTFSFIESESTAVMTVRFLILTTIATSRTRKSEFFAPFAAALSAIAFIRVTSSEVRLMLRDCRRCIACAENLSGSDPLVDVAGGAAVAASRTERNVGVPVGGMSTGRPTGRGAGPGMIPGWFMRLISLLSMRVYSLILLELVVPAVPAGVPDPTPMPVISAVENMSALPLLSV